MRGDANRRPLGDVLYHPLRVHLAVVGGEPAERDEFALFNFDRETSELISPRKNFPKYFEMGYIEEDPTEIISTATDEPFALRVEELLEEDEEGVEGNDETEGS